MVESILAFKAKLHNIVTVSFNSTTSFINTIKESFEDFINTRANKPAEMVAKHIDGLLKTSKGVTEEEIEVQLNECLGLFRFIQGAYLASYIHSTISFLYDYKHRQGRL